MLTRGGRRLGWALVLTVAVTGHGVAAASDAGTGALPGLSGSPTPEHALAPRARLIDLPGSARTRPREVTLDRSDERTLAATWRAAPGRPSTRPVALEANYLTHRPERAQGPGREQWGLAADARFGGDRLQLHAEFAHAARADTGGDAALYTARYRFPEADVAGQPLRLDLALDRTVTDASYRGPLDHHLRPGRQLRRREVALSWGRLDTRLHQERSTDITGSPGALPIRHLRADVAYRVAPDWVPEAMDWLIAAPRLSVSRERERAAGDTGQTRHTTVLQARFEPRHWSWEVERRSSRLRSGHRDTGGHETTRLAATLPLTRHGTLHPAIHWTRDEYAGGGNARGIAAALEAVTNLPFPALQARVLLTAYQRQADDAPGIWRRYRTEGWLNWQALPQSGRRPGVNVAFGGVYERAGTGHDTDRHYAAHARLEVVWPDGG